MSFTTDGGIRLGNNKYLQALTSGGAAAPLIKLNAAGLPELPSAPVHPDGVAGQSASYNQLVNAVALLIPLTQKGAANGVATLDGSGKVATGQLPAAIVGALKYKGTFDASTAAYPASPTQGDYYVVSVAGTVSGHAYAVGDWLAYDGTQWDFIDNSQKVSSVFGRLGAVVAVAGDYNTDLVTEGTTNLYYTAARFNSAFAAKTTDGLAEGTSNLYYTAARFNTAFAAKNTDALTEGTTNLYFTSARAKAAAPSQGEQGFTLSSTDITNGYVDLAQVAVSQVAVKLYAWGVRQLYATDYTVSLTGGAAGKTRVTFAGDTLTLAAGDKLIVAYSY